jgi:hypothetical protein
MLGEAGSSDLAGVTDTGTDIAPPKYGAIVATIFNGFVRAVIEFGP